MKRILLLTLALALFSLPAFAQDTDTDGGNIETPDLVPYAGPSFMIIPSLPEGGKAKKTMVEFPHMAHKDLACVTCHHAAKGKAVEGTDIFLVDKDHVMTCSSDGCHTDMKSKKGKASYYNAFHKKDNAKSCVGCHKMAKKAGTANPPVSCAKCHPKK